MDTVLEERWQAAVMPVALGVLDGYEFSEQGKAEAKSRLKELGVPTWAVQLREHLLERIAAGHSPFLPTFAIRFEAAVAGIWHLHFLAEDRQAAHTSALARFFALAFAPLAQRVETRQEYDTLWALHRFFESAEPMDSALWSDALGRFEQQAVSHQPRTQADFLAFWCIRISQDGICQPYEPMDTGLINRFVFQLSMEYQHCYGEEESPTEQIARAFLAALESRCPEPEWLQRFRL